MEPCASSCKQRWCSTSNPAAGLASRRARRSGLQLREQLSAAGLALQLWPSRLYALPVALFTVLWLRFLWRWYALILLASAEDARGFLLLFGLPFVLAGVSLIGTSLRLVLGRSVVALDAMRLTVGDEVFGRAAPAQLIAATVTLRDFVAECAVAESDDDTRELDGWQVRARLLDGGSLVLPLPVRTLVEADELAVRLNRGLDRVRAPESYRDAAALA